MNTTTKLFIIILYGCFFYGCSVHTSSYLAEKIHSDKIRTEFTLDDSAFIQVQNHLLGKGSYSEIYRGWDTVKKIYVAVKIQPYQEIEDIQHEIKQLKKVGLYIGEHIDFETTPPSHYLIMNYIPGKSIEHLYTSSCIYSAEEILNLMRLATKSLKTIHDLQLVHNDIHEGNLIVNKQQDAAKWIDFAFTVELPTDAQIQTIKMFDKSVPIYKAPESNIQRGYSTDLYQLGFMLLRMQLILSSDDPKYRENLAQSREFSFSEIKDNAAAFKSKPETQILLDLLADDWQERPTLERVIKTLQQVGPKPKSSYK